MLSVEYLFAGLISGFLIVSIFVPPKRLVNAVPTPDDKEVFRTSTGCVRIMSEPVPCSDRAVSLNVLVGK